MNAFTLLHVAISLVGLAAGFVVMRDFLDARARPGWIRLFLAATTATSVTGFFFPFHGFTPALGLGIISLAVLALGFFALTARRLAGRWRAVYVVTVVMAQYFNFFVLIVQSFQKIPALHALAPTQAEPPFALTQGAALVAFIVLGTLAVKRFRPAVAAG